MPKLAALPLLLLAATGATAWKGQCNNFVPQSVDGVQLVKATYYEANAFVNVSSLLQTITTSKLPAFCRLQLNVTTNPATGKAAYSELWLPDDWNSRTLGFGNGGWAGGGKTLQYSSSFRYRSDSGFSSAVPYGDIGLNGVAQGYASFGTNTGKITLLHGVARRPTVLIRLTSGHDSLSRDGTWGGPRNDDAIIDFAYRALHVTTVAAKNLAAQYYGYAHTKSYYLACSTGGRQGIKAMASFPEDYDGVV